MTAMDALAKRSFFDNTIYTLVQDNETVIYDLTLPPRLEGGRYITSTNYTYGFTFNFEEEFEVTNYTGWMRVNWWHSIIWTSIYVTFIFVGTRMMESRPKYELRTFLAVWNTFLAVFSTLGAIRTAPEMFHLLYNYGLGFTVCISGKP